MTKNISYQTDKIAQFFSVNRISWSQFYESEKKIINELRLGSDDQVLDIGCGCGGLGLALKEQFNINEYTGVEINALAAAAARKLNPDANILFGDILALDSEVLKEKTYDVVFSLSCIDWNVEFLKMLNASWMHVNPGGHMVATFRLTPEQGCADITKSYQFINYDGLLEGEEAAYVVLNINSLLNQIMQFDPAEIKAFGYWGPPSVTAVTPYKRLCFTAIAIQKRKIGEKAETRLSLNLPPELLAAISSQVP
jgi:SAM-dependent methyltransferase